MSDGSTHFHIKPSEVVLFLAGTALLVALPFLTKGNYTLWVAAKLLYCVGVVLFFLDR